jgi:type II secretory pathway component PulK
MNRKGFAMIMAILALPVAVVSIEAVASLVTTDIRQTHDAAVQAQVEQLLLAACIADRRGEPLTLPASLTAAARVHIEHEKNGNQIFVELDHMSRCFNLNVESTFP